MTALIIIKNAGLNALPDNAQWTHRMEIRSGTSSRLYIVAKHKTNGAWKCGCMGCIRFGRCKHLDAVRNVTSQIDQIDGITSKVAKPTVNATPGANDLTAAKRQPKSDEAIANAAARLQKTFSDEGFKHYDTANGHGSAAEWARMAEGVFNRLNENAGDDRISSAGKNRTSKRDRWLALIGADDMPSTLAMLKTIARKKIMEVHPDHGGSADTFRAVFAAYESLAFEVFGARV